MCPHISYIFRNNSNSGHVVVIGNSCRHYDMCSGSPLGSCSANTVVVLWLDIAKLNVSAREICLLPSHVLARSGHRSMQGSDSRVHVQYVPNMFDSVMFTARPKQTRNREHSAAFTGVTARHSQWTHRRSHNEMKTHKRWFGKDWVLG
jgi:hypothetical protein